MMPANVPKIRYKVPISLWLVEYIQRVKNWEMEFEEVRGSLINLFITFFREKRKRYDLLVIRLLKVDLKSKIQVLARFRNT